MNLFDQLVQQAMKTKPELHAVRAVVEKELLHHDILREMSAAGLLADLTFIGGTCLRACYGSDRLSEDLDFTGGVAFSRDTMTSLAGVLESRLRTKYGLKVTCSEPVKESLNVDTWKLGMVTRPERKELPAQRIHIDICAIPSHDRRPAMLRNYYGIDMGTSGLIIQAESRAEILADKMIALALRPNRIKNRDLWDLAWLRQQGVTLPLDLIPVKLSDRRQTIPEFVSLLRSRTDRLIRDPAMRLDFVKEMQRFLPSHVVANTVEKESFWVYVTGLVQDESARVIAAVGG
jgi:predicted nucleotidyltransferase component of viral defense system